MIAHYVAAQHALTRAGVSTKARQSFSLSKAADRSFDRWAAFSFGGKVGNQSTKLTAALIGLGLSVPTVPAEAQELSIKPILDFRLRHEFVDQEGIAREADALTLRGRAGAEASSGPWRLLAEAEATVPFLDDFDSGLYGKAGYPAVSDPKNLELNRLQLQYSGINKLTVTVGRQRILMEDHRFVGNSGWRQNEQTFDAVRLEYGDAKGLKADLGYMGSVRTIWGDRGRGARQEAVRGDNFAAYLGYATPIGTFSGFAILVDQEEPVVSLYRQSSKTVGFRLAGAKPVGEGTKLTYAASYASQTDHARNPNDYQANYYLTEAGIEHGALKLGIGREVLGADDGLPFTSFQTPLATLHKFQGWADKFLTTPPNGIRDLYGSVGYGWKKVAGFDTITPMIVYHRYRSDRLGIHYGNEWNASVAAKRGRWTATAKLADYQADDFASDTRKAWLQLEWAY
jgi:hypothetical protein